MMTVFNQFNPTITATVPITRIYTTFFVCFLLASILLVVIPPGGAPGAGLTYGFMTVLTSPAGWLGIILLTGICARFRRYGWGMLPIAYILAFLGGGLVALDAQLYPAIYLLGWGAALLVLLLVLFLDHRGLLLAAFVLMPYAFHMGGSGVDTPPPLADTLYFLFGQTIALGFLLASLASILLVFSGDDSLTEEPTPPQHHVNRPPHAP